MLLSLAAYDAGKKAPETTGVGAAEA